MKIKDIEQLKKIIELGKNKKLKGIKELREFSDFIAELVNKEYLDTMKVIKKEFKVLDDMVIDIVNNDELEPGEKADKILDLVDNFKNASEKMLQIRVSELVENSKPAITDKMTTLTHNSGLNHVKGLALLDPMFELVTLAFDTYIETCIEYVGNRLGYLLEATETALKVDLLKNLISSDPEKEEELISLLKRLRDLVKEMD